MALKKLILGAVAAASVLSAVPAAAVQTVFAQIDLLNSDRNFLFRRISGTTGDFYTTSTPTSSVPGAWFARSRRQPSWPTCWLSSRMR